MSAPTPTAKRPRQKPQKKLQSAIYCTEAGTLFVPTENELHFHEHAGPEAILHRAGLTTALWGKEWTRRYFAAHPWLPGWLYHRPEELPPDAEGSGLPTGGMFAFRRESTGTAILAASGVRSTGPLYKWLAKHREAGHEWYEGWLLRGEEEPAGVRVLTLDQIRLCRQVWDFAAHCRKAKIGPPNSSYCRWIMDPKQVPDLSWLGWLFGEDPPKGVFIIDERMQKLRKERIQERICNDAGVSCRTVYAVWQATAERREAFRAIVENVATGGGCCGAGAWDQVSEATKARMMEYARAATITASCDRAGVTRVRLSEWLRDAEDCGVRAELKRYLGISEPVPAGPIRCGFIKPHFFIPASGMLKFRKAAKDARAEAQPQRRVVYADLKKLPGYEEWFMDWTIPPARDGMRRTLLRPGTEAPSPAGAPQAAEHEPNNATPPKPEWRGNRRELWFNAVLCKKYGRAAPNQELVLQSFQELDWPSRIDDPLPQGKLADTIKDLQDSCRDAPLIFERDGTGKGITWRARQPAHLP
jgi:hypothetical protein